MIGDVIAACADPTRAKLDVTGEHLRALGEYLAAAEALATGAAAAGACPVAVLEYCAARDRAFGKEEGKT